LKEFLEINKVQATINEVTKLISDYDHNEDGKISLSEFIDELTPKTIY
jgi:Ca2+-binding EF-hand superfamily protein